MVSWPGLGFRLGVHGKTQNGMKAFEANQPQLFTPGNSLASQSSGLDWTGLNAELGAAGHGAVRHSIVSIRSEESCRHDTGIVRG